MKNSKMLAIWVLALIVWPVSTALGVVSLTVNGEAVDEITLREGQSCTVEIVSDNSDCYSANIGFDYGWGRGNLSHLETTPEVGIYASVEVYNEPSFQGYSVSAGFSPLFPPSPGVHFIFEYMAQEIGQTTLKLYDSTFTSVLDSVDITIRGMGTAFTYQGSLNDAGSPANGLYDFQFRLYDDANTVDGNQVGITIDVNDLDVIEGYFTLELDFGPDVFTGSARWLETTVAQSDGSDPCTLTPRVELTPTPYAIYAKTAGVQAPLHLTDLVISDAVIKGTNVTNDGSGVAGVNTGGGNGVYGSSNNGDGVRGENLSTGHYGQLGTTVDGAFGQSSAPGGSGVAGVNTGVGNGVYGRSNNGKGVHGVSSDGLAGYFNGDVTLTKPAGQGGGELVLRTATYNEAGRYRIRFENNGLGVFAGDDTQNQEFSFLSKWGGIREYDARLTIHGKASGSWGKFIELTHDGTDGKVITDTGNILLLPDANVGIGTNSPNEKLTVEGALSLDMISPPSASAGYGKVYVKSTDGELYFINDAGTEYKLSAGGEDFVVGEFLICANDTERGTTATGLVPLKESKIGRGGTLRIKFDLRATVYPVYAQIWRNNAPVGTIRTTNSTGYVTFTEDISGWSKGDLVQIRGFTSNPSYLVYVRNFRLYVDNPAEAGARL
jgi:hypothetical protein